MPIWLLTALLVIMVILLLLKFWQSRRSDNHERAQQNDLLKGHIDRLGSIADDLNTSAAILHSATRRSIPGQKKENHV